MRTVVCLVFLLLPYLASAAVSISEVAWMGSSESANHEWLELHNDGAPVDVTNWTLSDGMNLEISLVGTIPAGAYVVLERTSDGSAPGTAFLVYTGALVNTGATLKLARADGSVVDQVSGGEDWQNIGGDNVTKETAQYTSSGWVTAVATPGREITASEMEVSASDDQTETTSVKTTSGGGGVAKPVKSSEPVRLVVPDVTLELTIDAQTVGYVNQPIDFTVEPTGIGKDLINSLTYEWNFGDGEAAAIQSPEHIYQYPGTYVVTAYAGFKRQEQVARHEITILPVAVSLTTNTAGDVQVNNDSPYEVDLSGYRIRGEKVFTFPPRTIMLPNQTITIARAKLGQTTNRLVGFYDGEAALVASLVPDTLSTSNTTVVVASAPPAIAPLAFSAPPDQGPTEFTFLDTPPKVEAGPVVEELAIATTDPASVDNQAAVSAAPLPPTSSRWPYFALIGTLLIGTLGIYATPRRN